MVLSRRAVALGLALAGLLLGGCSESLFGAHPAGQGGNADGGSDGGIVPSTCPEGCIGDVAMDFPGGPGKPWRYLDDHRDRSWTAMTGDTTKMTGADPGNTITTCAAQPDAPACRKLPGALLVSSAGSQSAADPAIEFTSSANQVIQLSLHALVPSGADQEIRLYRNSREDVLFTGTATAGKALASAITLDALAGDRFLVAVAPPGNGATNVGLQLFVNTTGASFPRACQLALPFATTSTPNSTDDQCRGTVYTHYSFLPYPPNGIKSSLDITLGMGPFVEQGPALDINTDQILEPAPGHVLDWSHDLTVQFWVKLRQNPSAETWLFSDQDLVFGGGVGISLTPFPLQLKVTTCTDPTPSNVQFGDMSIPYPTDGSWQFIRAVRAGGTVYVCLNGQRMTSLSVNPDLPATFKTNNVPDIGIQAAVTSNHALFDGWLDDVRVITGALPCD